MSLTITIIPTREDNYNYLLQAEDGTTAIIDAGEATPILQELDKQNLSLDYILTTHHHYDHIEGNDEIKKKTGAKLVANHADSHRIPNIDIEIKPEEIFTLGNEKIQIIDTPGHTIGHICFYAPQSKALFCADTLFSLGCGRLFEGTSQQMWSSLQKIMALPDETMIFPGHEYTKSNGEFCLHIEPDNDALQIRMQNILKMREEGKPTIPVTIGMEKQTNTFLRASDAEHFATLRGLKDSF